MVTLVVCRGHFRSRWSRPLTVSSARTTRQCYGTSSTRRLALKPTYDFPPRNVERRRLDVSSVYDSLAVRRPVRRSQLVSLILATVVGTDIREGLVHSTVPAYSNQCLYSGTLKIMEDFPPKITNFPL